MMARNAHVAAALGACMPADFGDGAAVMRRALAAPELDGWIALPGVSWVAEAGIDDPATALPLPAALTPRFSAAGALRPFLARHPEATWTHLDAWAGDPDEHVRRLVAEGTRPRLPWTSRLRLRTLVAAGDPAALEALGLAGEVRLEAFAVSPARVALGGAVEVAATLAAEPGTPVVAHLLVHYRGAGRPPKPFVSARGAVPAGGRLTVRRRHAFRSVSIRTVRPGPHPIALQVNGRVLAGAEVVVTAAPAEEAHSSGAMSP